MLVSIYQGMAVNDAHTETTATSGTSADALAMLRALDPERFDEIGSPAPVAWFAGLVSSLRKQRDMSQTSLAAALSTTQPTISRLESGEVDPSFSRACDVLAVLGCRLVPAAIGDEPVVVTTMSEFQGAVRNAIEDLLPELERMATSDALVRLASTGMGDYAVDVDAQVGAGVRATPPD